jgi:hypothetical protein
MLCYTLDKPLGQLHICPPYVMFVRGSFPGPVMNVQQILSNPA